VTTALEDGGQNPYVQVEGGFLGGLALGVVPFGGAGHQVLDAADVLPHGTPEARRGLAVGLVVGGLISLVGGLTGEVVGGVATVTGIGAAVGVPAIAVSTTLVVGGAANIAAGLRGLTQSMMSSGSGRSGPPASAPATAAKGGLSDLAKNRAELGLKPGEGTLARLDVGGKRFYGINAHGQPVAPLGVNAISATHAEADAFAQAARAGVKGGSGTLYVDRALCSSCGTFGAVRSMARQLRLESLEVVTPSGTFTIIP
jgi:hypothetical protein